MNGATVMINHYIRIWFESLKEPIVLSVTEEDSQRFLRNYEGHRQGFFVCATKNHTHVAVNLQHVQLAHLLWEPFWDDEITDEDDSWVTLYFRDRDPMFFTSEDSVELVGIFFALESGIADEVMSFIDIDGKRLVFDPKTLLLLEASVKAGAEGEREMLEMENVPAQS